MADDLASLRAAETNAKALQTSGVAPVYNVGTVTSGTDEDGDCQVLVDGPIDISDDDTEDVGNEPVTARCWATPVSQGTRVRVCTNPDGTTDVVGAGGGQPCLIGIATIPGGETDVAVVSTAQVAISDLEASAEVLHPGHAVQVTVNVHLSSGAASNTLVGRVIRRDDEGNLTEVGRFLRSSAMGNNETIQAGVPVTDWDPEPGVYTYYPTVQASATGWSVILDPATTPDTAASLTVTDLGPLPPGAARVT